MGFYQWDMDMEKVLLWVYGYVQWRMMHIRTRVLTDGGTFLSQIVPI